MFPLKNRVKNQIQETISNFDSDLANKSKKLSEYELKKLCSFPEEIKNETLKGMGFGLAFGLFFYANMRKVPTISLKRRVFYIMIPLIITPLYYFLCSMEKFRGYKLYLALKIQE